MATQEARRLRRERANQAFFRQVNEMIREAGLFAKDERMEVLCECGGLECVESVPIALEDYMRIREAHNRFILVPGHKGATSDRIVEQNEKWLLVEARDPVEPLPLRT